MAAAAGAATPLGLPLPTEAQARQILIEHLDFFRLDSGNSGTTKPFSEDGLAALVRKSQHPRTLIAEAARRGYSEIDESAVEELAAPSEVVASDFGEGLDDAL